MSIEHLGRNANEIYKYVCDVDDCSNEYEFRVGEKSNNWQKIEVYEGGEHIITKFLCKKHHIV